MATAIDTNVLIYAHHGQFPEHATARRFLEKFLAKPDPYYLSWQVCYEYIRLTTHHRILKKPLSFSEALADMSLYFSNSRCQILLETSEHLRTLEEIRNELPSSRGNFIHDLHYAALLKEHAVDTIITADMDFRKFGFLTVINPLGQ